MATKVGMYSATHESVTVPDRKIRTALRTNQIARFVTVPSEKIINRLMYARGKFGVCKFVLVNSIFCIKTHTKATIPPFALTKDYRLKR